MKPDALSAAIEGLYALRGFVFGKETQTEEAYSMTREQGC
jgi:hypothetical protein